LVYTGCRYAEAASLVWSDFGPNGASVVIRAERAKGRGQRVVPLRAKLAEYFTRRAFSAGTPAVFPEVPTYEVLLGDFARAGVKRRDDLGRVVHFHAFRKTFQTLARGPVLGSVRRKQASGTLTPA